MDRDRDIREEQLRREAETNRTAGRPVGAEPRAEQKAPPGGASPSAPGRT